MCGSVTARKRYPYNLAALVAATFAVSKANFEAGEKFSEESVEQYKALGLKLRAAGLTPEVGSLILLGLTDKDFALTKGLTVGQALTLTVSELVVRTFSWGSVDGKGADFFSEIYSGLRKAEKEEATASAEAVRDNPPVATRRRCGFSG